MFGRGNKSSRPALTTSLLIFLTATGQVSLPIILGMVLILGVANAFENPARQAMLPSLIRRDTFQSAIALSSSIQQLAFTLGFSIGGVAISMAGVQGAYAITVALTVVSALLIVPIKPLYPVASSGRGVDLGLVKEGFSYVMNRQAVIGAMLLDTVAVIFAMAQALVVIFAKDVLEASRTVPVIVDFWAPWCGPCKTLQPTIEKVVKEAKGAVKLVKINIDQNQMLAQQLRIQSIPAVYAFFGGRPVDGFMGAVPESQVKQFVDRLVQAAGGAPGAEGGADDLAAALEHAKQAIAENDYSLAAQIYNELIEVAPDNIAAIAGLAKCHLQAGNADQAKSLLGKVPAKDKNNAEVVALLASIDLAEKAKEAGPVADLKAKAAADPKDFQTRLDLAMAYWAGEQRQEAIDELLAMIKLDRNWNEAAARQQLLKFFEALGFTDPLSVDGRKRLSTILFS